MCKNRTHRSRAKIPRRLPGESLLLFCRAEIRGLDLLVGGQLCAGALHEDGAGLHDVGPVGDLQRHVRVLLYQKHGNTALVYLAYNVKYSLDYQRRKAKRRFVHHNYLRPRHETAGDRELELFMAPFSSDHTQGGVLVVIHDVTEQRRSEQLKREFVANVSHELRTPLTNIKSYAETIVDTGDELPPELRSNFMNVIISEADRMTRIVQDLLTLSKIDYGKMEMNISRFPFLKAVQNVYDAAKLNAEQNHHLSLIHI